MKQKRNFIFIAMFVFFIGAANLYLFFSKGHISYSSISGRAIDRLPSVPQQLDLSLVIFIAQWIILLIIIAVVYAKFIHHRRTEHVSLHLDRLRHTQNKSETDLDIFYRLLKDKRKLRVSIIANGFKISKDIALEWGKILEDHDLARIEYPAFSEPEVHYYDKMEEELKLQHEKESKESGKEVKQEKADTKKAAKKTSKKAAKRRGEKTTKTTTRKAAKKAVKRVVKSTSKAKRKAPTKKAARKK